jgi:hypothetical protein
MDKKRREFYVEGVGHIGSVEEMAEKSGVTVSLVLAKLGKGATDEEIYYNKKVNFKVFSKEYQSIFDLKKDYWLKASKSSINYRLSKGATLEEIIIEEKKGELPEYYIEKGRPIVVKGKKYPDLMKAFLAYKDKINITYLGIEKRLERGLDPDTAFFAKKYQGSV